MGSDTPSKPAKSARATRENKLVAGRPIAAKAPVILYHYTSAAGFIGIMKNQCIWASSIYYLNDSREFSYARDLFRQLAEELLTRTRPTIAAAWRERLDPLLTERSLNRVHPFVFSLTAQGDLLSQWRAYGAPMGGFAIAFRTQVLTSCLPQGFDLKPCIYSEKQQVAMARRLLSGTTPNARLQGFHLGWIRLAMAFHHELATVFKHPAFFQEEEWRCVSPWFGGKHGWHEDVEAPKLEVRSGASTLIPYVALKIPEEAMTSLIAAVRIGPTPNVTLAIRAAESFLREHGISAEVLPSAIPFRPW